MAIKRGEKMALWVTGAIVFAVVVWAYVARKNATTPGASGSYASPNYLNYNYPVISWNPDANNPTGSASGLPTIPASGGDAGSACGCTGGTNGFYTSLNGMLQSFMQGASGAFQSYISNIESAIPSQWDQYINNPAGAAASNNAYSVLG